jgi:hypothetical protein
MKNKAQTERFQFGASQNSLNTLPNQIIVFFYVSEGKTSKEMVNWIMFNRRGI